MNPKLPKPIQDGLARGVPVEAHPSADMLTAFAEHSLSGGERKQITDHLALCGECREVVFLARSMAEDEVAEAPGAADAATGGTSASAARRWRWRLVWLPSAAALLIMVGVLVQQRLTESRSGPQMVANMDSNAPAPPAEPQLTTPVQPEYQAIPTSPEQRQAFVVPPEQRKKVATTAEQHHGNPTASQAKPAASQPSQDTQSKLAVAANVPATSSVEVTAMAPALAGASENGAMKAAPPAPDKQNAAADNRLAPSFAQKSQSRDALVAGGARVAAGSPLAGSMKAGAPRLAKALPAPGSTPWRVTAEGHLEHFTDGNWVQVLANEATAFRVVSVIGENVWAGSSDGALFHSVDSGKNWSRVSLPQVSSEKSDAIVSMQFDDALHGVVITESGSRFATRDGGVVWTKQ